MVDLLKTFGVWAVFTCFPPLILLMSGGPQKRVSVADVTLFFLPFLLIPAAGSVLLFLLVLRPYTVRRSLLTGILLGLFLPVPAALICLKIYPGFENQIGIVVGALIAAPFSAAGGGVAGWLQATREETSSDNQETP